MSLPGSVSRFPHRDKPASHGNSPCTLCLILFYSEATESPSHTRLDFCSCQREVLSTRATDSSGCLRFHHHIHPVNKAPAPLREGIMFSSSLINILAHSCLLKTNRTKQAKGEAAWRGRFGPGRPSRIMMESCRRRRRWGTEQEAHEAITRRWRGGELGCLHVTHLCTNWSSLWGRATWQACRIVTYTRSRYKERTHR